MWWSSDVADLARIKDRVSTLYLDRCVIDRTQNSITVALKHGSVRIPAALLGALLLGPGVTVTHGAISLLADSGTTICWVGENGVRLYASGTSPSSSSRVAERQAWLVTRPRERLGVARAMYQMRFPNEDPSALTMQQLLGREGSRVKRLYAENSGRTGVVWTGRNYIPGHAMMAGDDVNRLLSAANTALYGACHAAVAGVGAIASLGFVHTGHANSFVLDIADLYKHETTIPIAFDLAKASLTSERDARLALRDKIVELSLMERIVGDILELLRVHPEQMEHTQGGRIWNGLAEVPGGTNHAEALEAAKQPW